VIARTFSTIISLLVFIPITITLHKFLQTRNVFRTVNGVSRTPWAHDTKSWPTIMYFTIALASLTLNLFILLGYLRGVRTANKANTVGTVYDWLILGLNLGVWIAAIVVYRLEKDKNGVHNDLWGWSCSDAAEQIQGPFDGVLHFSSLCSVQVSLIFIFDNRSLLILIS
jgi:hypothetical protein